MTRMASATRPVALVLEALAALTLGGSCQPKPPPRLAADTGSYQSPTYAKGHFALIEEQGRLWFTAPDQHHFLSLGVNAIGSGAYRAPNPNFYDPVPRQFAGDQAAWVKSAFMRLSSWGFNTVGAWSDEALYGQRYPYTFMLYAAGHDHPLDHVFDPEFPAIAASNTAKAGALRSDPYLIGYFLDNELPWWGDYGWRASGQRSLLERYARAPAGAGKRVLREFLEQRYAKDIARFDRVYQAALLSFAQLEQPLELSLPSRAARLDADEFAGRVAEQFFSTTTRALREQDPAHLVLCVRFAGEAPWPVVRAASKYCDVISVNQYQQSGDIDRQLLDNLYAAARKPILITEYSFSAFENQSGDPNTKGAQVSVQTQVERAEHATRFLNQALALPYVVGAHWFEWADESPQGRFDGEDQNYGLVDLRDRPYQLLTQALQRVNRDAVRTHLSQTASSPTVFRGQSPAHLPVATPLSSPLLFLAVGARPAITTWGDAASGGSTRLDVSQADGTLIHYSSGAGWGAGISIPGMDWPFDARGASQLELRLQAPLGCTVQVLLDEVGVAAPGRPSYGGRAGSDGESYELPALQGTGKPQTYVIELGDVERRLGYGNQVGNQQLDLQALSAVDLYVPGKQGDGELRLISIRFLR